MEFILLMYRKSCWLNTPWQVLTAAPALHSIIIREGRMQHIFWKFCFTSVVISGNWLSSIATLVMMALAS